MTPADRESQPTTAQTPTAATSCARATRAAIEQQQDGEPPPLVTVERAEYLIRTLMQEHGLTAKGWTYKLDQTRHRLGLCHEGNKRLSFSVPFILCNTEEVLIDTIKHEIAHARAGVNKGHGRLWKLVALSIGARPEATCGSGVVSPDSRFHANCPSCGLRITRAVLPRARTGKLVRSARGRRRQRTGPLMPVVTYCSPCLDRGGRTRDRYAELALTWVETATGRVIEWPPKPAEAKTTAAPPAQLPTPEPTPAPEPERWEVKPITKPTQPRLF